jgi:hypothetical protein
LTVTDRPASSVIVSGNAAGWTVATGEEAGVAAGEGRAVEVAATVGLADTTVARAVGVVAAAAVGLGAAVGAAVGDAAAATVGMVVGEAAGMAVATCAAGALVGLGALGWAQPATSARARMARRPENRIPLFRGGEQGRRETRTISPIPFSRRCSDEGEAGFLAPRRT